MSKEGGRRQAVCFPAKLLTACLFTHRSKEIRRQPGFVVTVILIVDCKKQNYFLPLPLLPEAALPPDFVLVVVPAALAVASTAPLTAPLTASVAAPAKTSPTTFCASAITPPTADLFPVDFLAAGLAALFAAGLAELLDAAAFFAGAFDSVDDFAPEDLVEALDFDAVALPPDFDAADFAAGLASVLAVAAFFAGAAFFAPSLLVDFVVAITFSFCLSE
jgi:hypothetical protein